MIHIVVEKRMGFGGGGWDTGYFTYVIYQGKIIATNREKYNNSKFIAKIFRHLGLKYIWHRISTLDDSGQRRAERLFNKLLEETKNDKTG